MNQRRVAPGHANHAPVAAVRNVEIWPVKLDGARFKQWNTRRRPGDELSIDHRVRSVARDGGTRAIIRYPEHLVDPRGSVDDKNFTIRGIYRKTVKQRGAKCSQCSDVSGTGRGAAEGQCASRNVDGAHRPSSPLIDKIDQIAVDADRQSGHISNISL